ncbi:MAG: hypothetical protein HY720_21785 [Planctomycetes bacterium]|nr:hypothetical protein [Planctomycetota bacterium]
MPAHLRIRSLLAFAAILLAAASPAGARIDRPYEDLVVEYPEANESLAHLVAELYPELKGEVAHHVGRPYGIATRVVLCTNRAELVATLGGGEPPEWALAVARPGAGLIAIRISGLDSLAGNLRSTLAHEMTHLALGEIERRAGRPLPRWFDEGVCEWASRSLHLGAGEDLTLAAASDRLLPLAEIAEEFPEDSGDASLAYLESRFFVEDLAERHGRRVVAKILDRFEAGEDFDAAFEIETGESVREAEARWKAQVTPRFPKLWLLVRGMTLFSIAALLVVLAYARKRRRARRILDRWEAEEAGNTEEEDLGGPAEEGPWNDERKGC